LKIFFRADANTQTGLGHVSRLLALSEIIKQYFRCYFITYNSASVIEQQILTVCEEVINIPSFEDISSEAEYIVQNILSPKDLFVLDGYQFTTQYQQIIRSSGVKLICIDDLHLGHFYADVVINPAGGLTPLHYEGEIYTTYKLGPEFAPLKSAFRKAAQQRRQKTDPITQIFICFGGADYHNLTEKVVKACLGLNFLTKMHAIVGSAYLHRSSIEKIANQHSERILIHQNLSAAEMVHLMRQCQLAVAPASTIAYELCMVGIGLITGLSADNQAGIAQYLTAAKCATYVGNFHQVSVEELQQCIICCDMPVVNQHLTNQSLIFADNTATIQKIFQQLALESQLLIRQATEDDLLTYFHWANEAETRRQAIHSDFIELETHRQWFNRKIKSTNDFLFIFEQDGQPVGQVRFEAEADHYVISFSVDTHFRGKGLGTTLIKMSLEALQQTLGRRPKVKAYVKPVNTASLQVFRQNAFIAKGRATIEDVVLEVFEK
jgi:UDP-2,4-diacetamido-2,4,6-trideoxy-beta-L-altropyranose hydrolase